MEESTISDSISRMVSQGRPLVRMASGVKGHLVGCSHQSDCAKLNDLQSPRFNLLEIIVLFHFKFISLC